MENLQQYDLLIRTVDETKWVFIHYKDPIWHRDLGIVRGGDKDYIVVRSLEIFDDNEVETLPITEFVKAPTEIFKTGDILTMIEDGSKWEFNRYVEEGLTRGEQEANNSNWRGSEGWKDSVYVTSLEKEDAEEEDLPARYFTKI